MAHSNQSFAAAESSSYREEPATVELFDPHKAMRRGRSPQAVEPDYPAMPSIAGIPPLSHQSPPPIPLSEIPASVQARAGIPPQQPPSRIAAPYEAPQSYSPPPTVRQPPKSRRSRRPISTRQSSPDGMRSFDFRHLLAGSSILAGLVLIGDVGTIFQGQASTAAGCKEIVQQDVALSRDSLSQLLTVPERESKATVRNIVSEPYCLMPDLEVRAGVKAKREAYPLAFDPNTWLVLLYEGEEYAGYAFSFQP